MPDYAALAEQARKAAPSVDYAALAEQARRVTPPAPAPSSNPSDVGGLAMAATARAIPTAGRLAMEFATNPNVAKTFAAGGNALGAISAPIVGAVEGGPLGALVGVAGAAKASWVGGRTGWFTGKLAQNMSMPVAKALNAVTPYLQAVSTLSGAQGALDLAQMADPKRTDIGFLGIGWGDPKADAAHPALLNLLAQKGSDAVETLVKRGMAKADALRAYLTLKQYVTSQTPARPGS